jgi:nitroreductase
MLQPSSSGISSSVCEERIPHELFVHSLIEANRQWAVKAPVLMFSVARLDCERSGAPNRQAMHDVGLATENLILQTVALVLITHPMAGFDAERVHSLVGIPNGYEPVAAIALGYPGEVPELPEHLRARQVSPRNRRVLKDFVFEAQWAEPLDLAADVELGFQSGKSDE